MYEADSTTIYILDIPKLIGISEPDTKRNDRKWTFGETLGRDEGPKKFYIHTDPNQTPSGC